MQRLFLSWVAWLILEVLSLNIAAALLPVDSDVPQSSNAIPTFTRSYPDCNDRLFKETSSVSHELSLRCAWQSKRIHTLVHSFSRALHQQPGDSRLWSRPAPDPLPVRLFFPRKLPPPSATDDPFLS